MSPKIEKLDPANSILFLGSGFAAGAGNIAHETLPTGDPLRDKLARLLAVNPSDYDLQTIVEEFRSNPAHDLYQVLYETFTVTTPLPYQREILSLPWLRIYTTNYDDLVDVCKNTPGQIFPTFSYDDPKPTRLPRQFAVHLHGVIRKATPDNVLDQLVLDDISYVKQIADHPAWLDEFTRDLRFCDACYFLGYSLRDHHVSALMMQEDSSKRKTYFVTNPSPDKITVGRLTNYGQVLPIGVEAFATLCASLPRPEPLGDIRALRSFKFLEPNLDSKALARPTSPEIINLVTRGVFNQTRYFNSSTNNDYVTPRHDLIASAMRKLNLCRTLVVHSRLGNGKTIFLSILAKQLSSIGRKCFLWRNVSASLEQQIELLSRSGRIVIMFDNYDLAIENVSRLAQTLPEATFVVTVRTGHQEVRFHEILNFFPKTIERLDINAFSKDDRTVLFEILDNAGAHVDELQQTIRTTREIRDIVIALYDHTAIKANIEEELRALMQSGAMRAIIVSVHLLKWVGVEVEANFIRSVTGKDAYAELKKFHSIAEDLLRLDDDEIEVRSSLLSEYLVQKIFDAEDLLSSIHDIVTQAARRRTERRYRLLMGELMKFSTLRRIFEYRNATDIDLSAIYDRWSHDDDINREPLFWLQYAILMIDSDNLEVAQHFLETGYSRAEDLEGFQTYQLDTQALRLYVLRETRSLESSVTLFPKIIYALRKVVGMLADSSHRYYAVNVLNEIPLFSARRKRALKVAEANVLVFELNRAVSALDALSDEVKMESGSESVKKRLNAALAELVA